MNNTQPSRADGHHSQAYGKSFTLFYSDTAVQNHISQTGSLL